MSATFNRTSLESKRKQHSKEKDNQKAFNRTSLESKLFVFINFSSYAG